MLLGLGAASSALGALQSLTAKKSTPTTGVTQNRQTPDFFGRTESPGLLSNSSAAPKGSSSKSGALSPELMSALLAALGQTDSSTGGSDGASSAGGSNPLKDLFAQIDADGDGKLSKSEFENSLGAGGTNTAQADDVFSKMDKDGDGSVSLNEIMSALQGKVHRHQHQVGGATDAGGSGSDPLMKTLQGATSTTVTNSDGSTTTSLTYADGSKVTMTSPAASSASGAATSSYNFIEQMIARQAKAISSAATASLSVSA
ncbi:EF-hand domain-containing protein [Bradyrhizobium sediminis]|uniref:EF-hand domain-containing protein n=1 Tax=Bradyrhizobium sediminis TaxID=2840469 RepID=A0A975NIF6_9BRAD|nr:EF-hand domain-containing protein [Bradyrhizobium sediminis]QWG15116.1 EF-hand domain-containing protein [Bradyrhizobium sediminis]